MVDKNTNHFTTYLSFCVFIRIYKLKINFVSCFLCCIVFYSQRCVKLWKACIIKKTYTQIMLDCLAAISPTQWTITQRYPQIVFVLRFGTRYHVFQQHLQEKFRLFHVWLKCRLPSMVLFIRPCWIQQVSQFYVLSRVLLRLNNIYHAKYSLG